MGIFDALFGRQKPAPTAKDDRIFAITTAEVTLVTRENLTAGKEVGICFKGLPSGPFAQVTQELHDLLKVATSGEPITSRDFEDNLGYKWILLTCDDFQTLITTLHMVSQTLIDEGYGEQLLAAAVRFNDSTGKPSYFIYNFKRGNFYPFVPRPDSHSRNRDNAEEVRLTAALKGDLPFETELERWYAMWDLPF